MNLIRLKLAYLCTAFISLWSSPITGYHSVLIALPGRILHKDTLCLLTVSLHVLRSSDHSFDMKAYSYQLILQKFSDGYISRTMAILYLNGRRYYITMTVPIGS